MDSDQKSKLLIGLAGIFVGWVLKELRDYYSRRQESECSLRLLEGELGTIRSHAAFAIMFRDNAPSTGPKEKEAYMETGKRLIKSLPQIEVYQDRFDSIARALTEKELDIAKNVVTYYNAMRRSIEEACPDLDGVLLLETIVSCRRKLIDPIFGIFRPREQKRLRRELQGAVKYFEERLRHEEERSKDQT
jgi:hypothetical protein